MKRWLLVLLLFAVPRTAEARVAIANTGEKIWYLGDAPPEYVALGMPHYGFKYERMGLFWVDFSRSDGEFVVYGENTYNPISSEEAERHGLQTRIPWSYHLPIGLMIVVIIVVGVLVRHRRRLELVAGAGALGFAPVFYTFDGGLPATIICGLWGLANIVVRGASSGETRQETSEETQVTATTSCAPGSHMTEKLVDGTVASTSGGAPSP